jgi:hypothetical protein
VDVAERGAGPANGIRNVVLLADHVERVQVHLHVRQPDVLNKPQRVRRDVDEVGLEAVHRLDAQHEVGVVFGIEATSW